MAAVATQHGSAIGSNNSSRSNRHTYMTSGYIVAQLARASSLSNDNAAQSNNNSSSNNDNNDNNGATGKISVQPRVDQQEIFDNPAMQTATKCCVFIKEIARKMGFPARTASTAQLLVYRTYIYRPTTRIGSTDLATGCLLVSSKMEETIKKLRDIIAYSYVLLSKPQSSQSDPKQVASSVIDKMRPNVMNAEQLILEAIGYDFRTSHTHLLFVKLAKMAGLTRESAVATSGWAILLDAYFTTLPIQYPSTVISAGSLVLAWCINADEPKDTCSFIRHVFMSSDNNSSHHSNGGYSTLPKTKSKRPPTLALESDNEWWVDFGVSTTDIQGFVKQMVDFYLLFFNSTMATAEYLERHKHGIPNKSISQKIAQWRLKLSDTSSK
ncbi:RNA polymerase II C-terminal domain kinase beta subunit [Coemansia sp. RSA 1939]|nr:RNA polymerase II C-terminal domain kinase beta subunit [Coemansia sp. RSA 1939]